MGQHLYLLKIAAKSGSGYAQSLIASQCYFGNEEMEKECIYWLKEFAEQGDSLAQYHLAFEYFYGNKEAGIEKNKDEFLRLLNESAINGNRSAQEMAIFY